MLITDEGTKGDLTAEPKPRAVIAVLACAEFDYWDHWRRTIPRDVQGEKGEREPEF